LGGTPVQSRILFFGISLPGEMLIQHEHEFVNVLAANALSRPMACHHTIKAGSIFKL
jgi:hypothetical protein